MFNKRIIAVLLSAFVLVGCSNNTVGEKTVPVQKDSPAIADDYYAAVNAELFRNAALYYGNNELSLAEEQLYELISGCISDEYAEGYSADIRTLYNKYKDTEKREADGIAVLQKGLDAAANAKNINEYLSALALLYREYGCEVLLRPVFAQDPYNSGSYVCQLGDISFAYRPKQAVLGSDDVILTEQRAFEMILPMLGYSEEEAKELAKKICLMLIDIAEHSMDDSDRLTVESTYHKYYASALNELYGGADIAGALSGFGIAEHSVIVFDEGNAAAVGSYLTEENLPMLRAYAQLCLINTYGNYLPQQYKDVTSVLGGGRMSEDEAAVVMLDSLLKEELGALYYEKYCDAETETQVTKLCEDIRDAYKKQIQGCARLSDVGKEKILQKLDNMIFLIGGASECEGEYEVSHDCGLLESVVRIKRGEATRNLEKANSSPDRTEWSPQMSPYEVNGLYDKSRNTVTVTAGAIQEMYSPELSYAENLGTLGVVIAHEISHAFDSSCILYDSEGNYDPDHFAAADRAVYDDIQNKVEAYYASQTIVGLYHVDGKATLAENIADIAAVQCLVTMLDSDDGKRSFFEAYAGMWGSIETIAEAVDALARDEHSPNEIRCNAVLSLTDEFCEVYDIREGDGMYIAPADRIRIW